MSDPASLVPATRDPAAPGLALLLMVLRELPRKCRQAFLLHRFRDLSTSEVAVTMGLER
ncbi:MAG: sigma factor-like helix-turn-helix DNA-binding protein [Gammaproteobacteria bacterium]